MELLMNILPQCGTTQLGGALRLANHVKYVCKGPSSPCLKIEDLNTQVNFMCPQGANERAGSDAPHSTAKLLKATRETSDLINLIHIS